MPAAGERAARLAEMGWTLPTPPQPLGQYTTAVRAGSALILSGMLPLDARRPAVVGRLGEERTVDEGRHAAQLAALNALAVAAQAAGGLDRVGRLLRVTVFMTTTPTFTAHAAVADGASAVFAALFAEPHTRRALGAYTLPLGATVAVDTIFELSDEAR
jgi:enamine deaminase RidA (YjgF/YER057c/UK114 family)